MPLVKTNPFTSPIHPREQVPERVTPVRETIRYQLIEIRPHDTGVPAQDVAFQNGRGYGWKSPRVSDTILHPNSSRKKREEGRRVSLLNFVKPNITP